MVDLYRGDLADPTSLARAGDGMDTVFLLAGYGDPAAGLRQLATAQVAQVILLSSGCVEGGNLDNHAVRYNVTSRSRGARRGPVLDRAPAQSSAGRCNGCRKVTAVTRPPIRTREVAAAMAARIVHASKVSTSASRWR